MSATRSMVGMMVMGLAVAGCSKPDLSMETHAKLKVGMKLAEVELIVGGKARVASESVKREVAERAARFGRQPPTREKPGATKYYFHRKNAWLFVDIDNDSGLVVGYSRWASSSGKNMKRF